MKRTESQQSPYKLPKDFFHRSLKERENQEQDTDEKMSRDAGTRVTWKKSPAGKLEEEEEEGKSNNLKQVKTRTASPKQKPFSSFTLKMAMMKRENLLKDTKYDLVSMERQKAVLELSLMSKNSEILKMDEAVAKEQRQLEKLEMIIESDNLRLEEVLRENEKKAIKARTFFKLEAESKQEKNVQIKKLSADIGSILSEITKYEETLIDYKRYKELLFTLSPPEWQQAQKKKALKILCDRSPAGVESEVSCPGLPSIRETGPTSAHGSAPNNNSALESNSSESEDEPMLYFSDPQQLMDLVTELTEQNLSLIQNSSRVVETLEEFQTLMEKSRKKMEQVEKQLTQQINDMNQRLDKVKAKGTKLSQKVQLHVSLITEDTDIMLETLDEKVTEVHNCCVDNSLTHFSTLEKLANVENCLSTLLQSLESIPEDSLLLMRKMKDSERRSRLRDKKLREQQEKQVERMKRYLEKSLADSKKMSTRKLMPRYMPVSRKAKVSQVDTGPSEEEIHGFLFSTDNMS